MKRPRPNERSGWGFEVLGSDAYKRRWRQFTKRGAPVLSIGGGVSLMLLYFAAHVIGRDSP